MDIKDDEILQDINTPEYEARDHVKTSGLQNLWQNCKKDLATARRDAVVNHRLLLAERAKLRTVKQHTSHLLDKIASSDTKITNVLKELKNVEAENEQLKKCMDMKDRQLNLLKSELNEIKKQIEKYEEEINTKCAELEEYKSQVSVLLIEVTKVNMELSMTRDKLTRWPINIIKSWPSQFVCSITTNLSNWWVKLSSSISDFQYSIFS